MMTVTHYNEAAHGGMVAEWWAARHRDRLFQFGMLPPVGVVAEDEGGPCAACWMHLSAGVGVAFIENPVTKPGMPLTKARDTLLFLMEVLEKIALEHDYGVMVAHTMPAIARTLMGRGFTFGERTFLNGTKILR